MRNTFSYPTSAKAHRVELLDLLRLIAILGVAAFHFGFLGPTSIGTAKVIMPEWAPAARYGYLGVPAFFAISGFVIAYSAVGRTAADFAIARITRIYPTFLLCMTLTFLVTLLFGAPLFETSLKQWFANLPVVAPAFGQPYMDLPYWSLVIELTFYAWVTVFIAFGWLPRRIDIIVLAWLGITMVNELTIDARMIERLFLTDYSGFFCTGLLAYELSRGRRDATVQCLLGLSVTTAVFQAVHGLGWLRYHTGSGFSAWIAATICLASMTVIVWAPRLPRPPLPPKIILAIGGLTYPFYLLHQQIGYVVLERFSHGAGPLPWVLTAYGVGVILLAFTIWRFFERPGQTLAKRWLIAATTSISLAVWPDRHTKADRLIDGDAMAHAASPDASCMRNTE